MPFLHSVHWCEITRQIKLHYYSTKFLKSNRKIFFLHWPIEELGITTCLTSWLDVNTTKVEDSELHSAALAVSMRSADFHVIFWKIRKCLKLCQKRPLFSSPLLPNINSAFSSWVGFRITTSSRLLHTPSNIRILHRPVE